MFAFLCKAMEKEYIRSALYSAQSNATYRVFNECDLKITGMMLMTQAHFRGYSSMKVIVNPLSGVHMPGV